MVMSLSDKVATKAGGAFVQKIGRHAYTPKRRKHLARTYLDKAHQYGRDAVITAAYAGVKHQVNAFEHKSDVIMAIHNGQMRHR